MLTTPSFLAPATSRAVRSAPLYMASSARLGDGARAGAAPCCACALPIIAQAHRHATAMIPRRSAKWMRVVFWIGIGGLPEASPRLRESAEDGPTAAALQARQRRTRWRDADGSYVRSNDRKTDPRADERVSRGVLARRPVRPP